MEKYKYQINNLIDSQNWNGLVKYANELRKQKSTELPFGLKSNFFNIIETSDGGAIDLLETLGFYVISGTGPEILRKVKNNEIKIEDANIQNIGIVTKSTSLAGDLSLLNFPICTYKFYSHIDYGIYSHIDYDDIDLDWEDDIDIDIKVQYNFINLETNKTYSFDKSQLSGIIREEKINSIIE